MPRKREASSNLAAKAPEIVDLKSVVVGGFKAAAAIAVAPIEPVVAATLALDSLSEIWRSIAAPQNITQQAIRAVAEAYYFCLGRAFKRHLPHAKEDTVQWLTALRREIGENRTSYDLLDFASPLTETKMFVDLRRSSLEALNVLLRKEIATAPLATRILDDVERSYDLAFRHILWLRRKELRLFHEWYRDIAALATHRPDYTDQLDEHARRLRQHLFRPLPVAQTLEFSNLFTLDNMYVEQHLRLYNPASGRKEDRLAVGLLLELIDSEQPIVIHGQPGHGKTSLARMLCAILLKERPDVLPLLIEFNSLRPGLSFLDYLSDTFGGWLTPDYLRHTRAVILVDGIDEAQTVSGDSTFLTTFNEIQHFVQENNLLADCTRITSIYTGRSTFVDTYNRCFPRSTIVLELVDFDSAQQREWLTRFQAATGPSPEDGPTIDRLNEAGLGAFLGQPVLLTLICLMWHDSSHIPSSGGSPQSLDRTDLYHRIVEWTYRRHWAGPLANRLAFAITTIEDYHLVLDCVALAIYKRGHRSIPEHELLNHLEQTPETAKFGPTWEITKLLRMARISFYFRHGEESAFEFAHKSIEDYLVAHNIARVLRDIGALAPKFEIHESRTIVPMLLDCVASRALDVEHCRFLVDIYAKWPPDVQSNVMTVVQRLWRRLLLDFAVPLDKALSPPVSAHEASVNLGLSILHILTSLHLKAHGSSAENEESTQLALQPKGLNSRFKQFFLFVDSTRLGRFASSGIRLSLVDLRDADLSGLQLDGLDFSRSNLTDARFTNSSLVDAQFRDAKVAGVDFRGAVLERASFKGANLNGCQFSGAKLGDAEIPLRYVEAASASVTSGFRVLVIDDEEVVLDVFRMLLGREGMTVETASTAEEGLERTREQGFDVTLLDLMLPGMNGIDFLDELRSVGNDSPVIVITAFSSIESAVECIQHGASHYIPKPFKIEEVLGAIRRVTNQRLHDDVPFRG